MNVKKVIKEILGQKVTYKIREKKHMKKLCSYSELINNIKENVKFSNMHDKKRCFILGNGPSLRNVNMELLKDEIIFSVNNFSKVENFRAAEPEYHLWIDSAFFNMRTDMTYDYEETLKSYKLMSEVSPTCFVPDFAYSFIKQNKIDTYLDINYISISGNIKDIKINDMNFDITSVIPAMSTVVQYAIVIAIYMGFSEIYLLGCDSTGIQTTINCALNVKNDIMHAYGNDNAEKELKQLLSNWNMSQVFYDQYLLFLGYEKLYDYCSQKGIEMFNCSEPTLVGNIPRKSISDILNNNKLD